MPMTFAAKVPTGSEYEAKNQRLRCEVKEKIRLRETDCRCHRGTIADIALPMRGQTLLKAKLHEQRRLGGWNKREAMDFRTEKKEPFAQPAALESGVTGHQDASVGEGVLKAWIQFINIQPVASRKRAAPWPMPDLSIAFLRLLFGPTGNAGWELPDSPRRSA